MKAQLNAKVVHLALVLVLAASVLHSARAGVSDMREFVQKCIETNYDDVDTDYPSDCVSFFNERSRNKDGEQGMDDVFDKSMERMIAANKATWEQEILGEINVYKGTTQRFAPRPTSGSISLPSKAEPINVAPRGIRASGAVRFLQRATKQRKRLYKASTPAFGGRIWKQRKVFFTYDPDNQERTVNMFNAAVEQFNSLIPGTCLRFQMISNAEARTFSEDYFWVQDRDKGNYCHKDATSGVPDYLNLNAAKLADGTTTEGTILHEMMHAVGFMHTHQRSDRSFYITITQSSLVSQCAGNFVEAPSNAENIGKYDYGSIMHYGPIVCSKTGIKTIKSKAPKPVRYWHEYHMGQRVRLSKQDIKAIKRLYDC